MSLSPGHAIGSEMERRFSPIHMFLRSYKLREIERDHFAKLHTDLVQVVLVCDRYSAYKSLAKAQTEIVLAYCWAHVRRDFLNAARSWPDIRSIRRRVLSNVPESSRLRSESDTRRRSGTLERSRSCARAFIWSSIPRREGLGASRAAAGLRHPGHSRAGGRRARARTRRSPVVVRRHASNRPARRLPMHKQLTLPGLPPEPKRRP